MMPPRHPMRHLALVLGFMLGLGGCTAQEVDFRSVVSSAKNRVFPAVVYIKCLRESHESGKKVTQSVSGSGVIISAEGEVVTNWHVIDKATEIRCLLSDGRDFPAEKVGSDKDVDLGLLRLKMPEGSAALPFATLGDSEVLKEGDFVMAMGAPWGLSRSVSIGIISCSKRFLDDHSEYSLWLQTDADICPGNSGGPLVNTGGEVIGINTLGGQDVGFAVPATTVGFVVSQLRAHGQVKWSWTGLQVQPLRDFERNIVFDLPEGVIVAGADPESPADQAGLKSEDCILSIGDLPITAPTPEDMPAVRRRLGLLDVGKPMALRVLRKGEVISVTLSPREKGKVEGEEIDCPRWDMTLKMINQHDNPEHYFYRKNGFFIFGLKSPGNAGESGLREGDILMEFDGDKIDSAEVLDRVHAASLETLDSRPRHLVTVLRNGLMRQVVLDIQRDFERR